MSLPLRKMLTFGFWPVANLSQSFSATVQVNGKKPEEIKDGQGKAPLIQVSPGGSFTVRLSEPSNGLFWKENIHPEEPGDHYCIKVKRRYSGASSWPGFNSLVFEFEARNQPSKKPIEIRFDLLDVSSVENEVKASKVFRVSVG